VAKKFVEDNLTKYQDNHYHRNDYKILGVDLKNISPIEEVDIMKLDITKPSAIIAIQNYLAGEKFDLILSDASIKKSGNKFTDHLKQINLCYKILELAKVYLKFKGILVMKTFQGTDFNNLLSKTKPLFRILKTFKPSSSKKKSNEIYLIGMQKK